jgi:hypothetical protein
MNRFHPRRNRSRQHHAALPPLDPAFSPWLRFELEDDCIAVISELIDTGALAISGEVQTRTRATPLAGELIADRAKCSIRYGLSVADSDGQVHDIDFDDIRAFRFRLDEHESPDVLHIAWDTILDHMPLLGLHLATGELRTGLPVGFEIDSGIALTARTASAIHLLPIPLEALNTETTWTMVRLAMYGEGRRLRDRWVAGHWFGSSGDDDFIDTHFTGDVRSIAWLENAVSASLWRTNVVPAFGLVRPIVERTRLWFAEDAREPFRRTQVDTDTNGPAYGTDHRERWPAEPRRATR